MSFSKSISKPSLSCFAALGVILVQGAPAALVSSIHDYDGQDETTLPARLSETGLYDNTASAARAVTSAIVRFEVNNALWSDGAPKERWITLPAGAKVTPTDTSNYTFPDKSVLIKNFMMDTVYGSAASRILIETRFLVIRMDGTTPVYHGITYKWRRDQTDAERVSAGGLDTVLYLRMGDKVLGKRWAYPSASQCRSCHFGRGVLGFVTPQLNRMMTPAGGGASINQLQSLFAANVLASNPVAGKPDAHRWVGMEETGAGITLERKARSYFASNCSHCHGNGYSPEGAEHNFDYFRAGIKIAADTAGGYVGKETVKLAEYPKVVYPAYAESSLVLMRMMSRKDGWEMPTLATYQMDSVAVKVIKDWICAMGTRGAACKLPAVKAEYWEPGPVGIYPHAMPRARSSSGSFLVRGLTLTLVGQAAPGEVFLMDNRGRQIKLSPAGDRAFRLDSPLKPGVYFLKTGSKVARVRYLP